MFVCIRSAAFVIVVTQKLVLQQSKNVRAKCTETLSPPSFYSILLGCNKIIIIIIKLFCPLSEHNQPTKNDKRSKLLVWTSANLQCLISINTINTFKLNIREELVLQDHEFWITAWSRKRFDQSGNVCKKIGFLNH